MYNWGFRTFIDDLLAKAQAGYFFEHPKELAEYQTALRHGMQKFGIHPLDKNGLMDELRRCGIRPKGEGGWALCGGRIGKENAGGAEIKPCSTRQDGAAIATTTTECTKSGAECSR